jgi:hypothetical protein
VRPTVGTRRDVVVVVVESRTRMVVCPRPRRAARALNATRGGTAETMRAMRGGRAGETRCVRAKRTRKRV